MYSSMFFFFGLVNSGTLFYSWMLSGLQKGIFHTLRNWDRSTQPTLDLWKSHLRNLPYEKFGWWFWEGCYCQRRPRKTLTSLKYFYFKIVTYLIWIQSNLNEIRLLCLIMAFTVTGKNYRRISLHAINYGFIYNCNLPVVGSNANYFPTKFCKVGQVSHL